MQIRKNYGRQEIKPLLRKLLYSTSAGTVILFTALNASPADPSIWASQPLERLIEEGLANNQDINERLIKMLTQLLKVSETRYAAGQGLQQDVLHAQVELSKLLDEQITLGNKLRTLEDRISGLLNRENFIPVAPPENLPYPGLIMEIEKLKTRALTLNPWLKVKQAEIELSNVRIALARKDYWPDNVHLHCITYSKASGYNQRSNIKTIKKGGDAVYKEMGGGVNLKSSRNYYFFG